MMHLKSLIAKLLLVPVVLASIFVSLPVAFANGETVKVGPVAASQDTEVGDIFAIPVSGQSFSDVKSMSLVFNYDSTDLDYNGITYLDSAMSSANTVVDDSVTGVVSVTWTGSSALTSGNYDLFNLKFEVLSVTAGTTDIEFAATSQVADTAGTPSSNVIFDDSDGTVTLGVDNNPSWSISAFEINPATGFDPSDSGDDENLEVSYTLSEAPDSLYFYVYDFNNDLVESATISTPAVSGSQIVIWDGEYINKLAEPGNYKVKLVATKTGYTQLEQEKTLVVAYGNASKPAFTDFTVTPETFDPGAEDCVFEFTNTNSSYITFEIRKSDDQIRGFNEFDDDEYSSGSDHTATWNGKNDSGSEVSEGTYYATLVGRNEYGVTVEELAVEVDDSSNISISNDHITNISFSPSSTFEPADDEEMAVRFKVIGDEDERDDYLDELRIVAVRGTTEIELYDESDVAPGSYRDE
ncbi:cohesin domain-containing protein, partial [Patescibacteria group bacterium]|nr:cohesin domain-containing protein [Patescibacteria group bacterium]